MSDITWALEADLDRDGTFETDLTEFVTEDAGGMITFERGVDRNGEPSAGASDIVLDNSGGEFSRRNLAGTFARYMRAGFALRLTGTLLSTGYTLGSVYATKVRTTTPAEGLPTAEIQSTTLFGLMQEAPLVYVNASDARDTDGAMEAVRTAAGMDSGSVDFDDGEQALPWHFAAGQNPLEAFIAAANSEMGGHFYEKADGVLKFEGRRRRRGVSAYDLEVLKDSPLVHWRFREATGATVYDLSGNGRDLTLYNTPTRGAAGAMSPHDPAKATTFNGTTQYGATPDAAALDVADTFTIEAIIKPDAIGAAMAITSKGSGEFYVNVNASGNVVLEKTGVGAIVTSTATLSAGTVYHVVVTKSGATVKIYVDGVDVSGAVSDQTMGTSANEMLVGVLVGGTAFFDGLFASFSLHATALSATRIAAHYRAYLGNHWGPESDVNHVSAEVADDDQDLITSVEVRGTKFLEGQGNEVLFAFSANMYTRPDPTSVYFAANVPWKRRFQMKSAYISLTAQVSGQDYKFTDDQDGGGTDQTANVTVTVTDLGGFFDVEILPTVNCYCAYFEIRGQSLQFFADQPSATVELAAPASPNGRGVQFDVPFAGDSQKLLDYAMSELSVGRYALDRLVVQMLPVTDAEKAAMLARDLGDLVYFDDTGATPSHRSTYTKDWLYIEGVRDEVPASMVGESWHAQTRLVPADAFRDIDRMVYDDFARDNASGELGTSLSGDAWVGDTGFDLSSGTAIPNTNSAQVAYMDLGALAWHMVVECELSGLSGSDAEAGVCYGSLDASNYYRCYVDRGDSLVHIDKVVGGTPTSLFTAPWTQAATAQLRVRLQEGRHRVDLDGYPCIDEEDFSLNTGTKAGLYTSAALGEAVFTGFRAGGL